VRVGLTHILKGKEKRKQYWRFNFRRHVSSTTF